MNDYPTEEELKKIESFKLHNTALWIMCWKSSKRGGHYEFELPNKETDHVK